MSDKSKILSILGDRIREKRLESGISQRLLGANIDMDERHLRRIEKGGVNTTILVLYDICEELDMTLIDLLSIL